VGRYMKKYHDISLISIISVSYHIGSLYVVVFYVSISCRWQI